VGYPLCSRIVRPCAAAALPLIVAVFPALAYAHTLAPGITWANGGSDSGDLVTAAATLGIAHPTGYPTYLLLVHLFQYLPVSTLAFRANVFSAWVAVATVLWVFFTVRSLLDYGRAAAADGWQTYFSATIATFVLAFSPLFWSQAVIAEVSTLNTLFVALLVRWTIQASGATPNPHGWQDRGQAFLAGLALGNHMTILLPLVVWLVTRIVFAARPLRLHVLLRCLGWVAMGSLVYLYLPLRAATYPPINWGNPQTWDGFWWVVSAEPYRDFVFGLPTAFWFARLRSWATLLREQFDWIGVGLGFLGLLYGGERVFRGQQDSVGKPVRDPGSAGGSPAPGRGLAVPNPYLITNTPFPNRVQQNADGSPPPQDDDDSVGKVRAGTRNTTNTTKRCGGRDVACNVSPTKTACTNRVDEQSGSVEDGPATGEQHLRQARGWRWVAVCTLVLVAGYSLFAMMYDTADSVVYLLPVFVVFALWIGVGSGVVLAWVTRWQPAMPPIFAGGLALLLFWHVPATAKHVDASRDWRAIEYAHLVLRSAPPHAIILTHNDRETFPLWYEHFAAGRRTDIVLLVEPLIGYAWYQQHVHARYPDIFLTESDGTVRAGFTATARRAQRSEHAIVFPNQLLLDSGGKEGIGDGEAWEHVHPARSNAGEPPALPGSYRFTNQVLLVRREPDGATMLSWAGGRPLCHTHLEHPPFLVCRDDDQRSK
jgi:hypothetical protein